MIGSSMMIIMYNQYLEAKEIYTKLDHRFGEKPTLRELVFLEKVEPWKSE